MTHPFTNDRFEHAYLVTSLPFRARTDTQAGSRQASEPSNCASAGGTAWYHYRPSTDVALFADTFGTGGTTALGVFRGTSLHDLQLVSCDTNVLGNSQIGFRAAKGATYYFQVTSPLGGGPTVFELAAVGATTVETVSPTGGSADQGTTPPVNRPEISTDGRWITFASAASNLAHTRPDCGDPTGCHTIYLRDRMTGTTKIVATTAKQGGGGLAWQTMSANGRYVGFGFKPGTLPGGFQGADDAPPDQISVYLYDRITGGFELVSRNSAGEPARGTPGQSAGVIGGKGVPFTSEGSQAVVLSADGRYVAFTSNGTNLGGRTEQAYAYNVYWRDRVTGVTRLVSVDSVGEPMVKANSYSCAGRNISGDGRYVFFCSTFGTGSSPGDNNALRMLLYLWDAKTGRTRLVTPLPQGGDTKGSFCPSLSLDGRRAAFTSNDALVADDTNGGPDVYSYDIATRRLQRVSVTSAGEQTTDLNYPATESSPVDSRAVTLSADGRYIAFDSAAPDLVPTSAGGTRQTTEGSTPGPVAVYVHDMITGATVLASQSATGEPLAGYSVVPYISADGRWVAFFNSSRQTTSDLPLD
ncbi:MAG: TolB family protein, partial [Nocardioidaceae bacterium]